MAVPTSIQWPSATSPLPAASQLVYGLPLTGTTSPVLQFLQPRSEEDFRAASVAYHTARESLRYVLPKQQVAQLDAMTSIEDVLAVALEIEKTISRGQSSHRMRSLALALDKYSAVLDVFSQGHADYLSLIWGTIKMVLVFAAKYIEHLHRISSMLEDISRMLPRLHLYDRLFPTRQMTQTISELYATIVGFLVQVIRFLYKPRFLRYMSMISGSLEFEFRTTIDKIRGISHNVESDAGASALAYEAIHTGTLQRQMKELTFVTQHTLRCVLQVKEQQTAMLLKDIRSILLHSSDHHYVYQGEIIKAHTCFVAPEWTDWCREEIKHIAFYRNSRSNFAYAQTEDIQTIIGLNLLQGVGNPVPCSTPRISLHWAPTMTCESAIACLIYQLLVEHPDKLLYRNDPNFYQQKFQRAGQSFMSLWTIYQELVSALPGLRCMLTVESDSADAATFVKTMIEFHSGWSASPYALLVYHVTDENLAAAVPCTVELDKAYDISLDMNGCESLFRVALLELGVWDAMSPEVQSSLWSGLWKTLRYNLMVMTYDSMLSFIGEDALARIAPSQVAGLKASIIKFFQCIERRIPPECRERLTRAVFDKVDCDSRPYEDSPNYTFGDKDPSSEAPWRSKLPTKPLTAWQRAHIWASISSILQATIYKSLYYVAEDHLSLVQAITQGDPSADEKHITCDGDGDGDGGGNGNSDGDRAVLLLRDIEGIFSSDEWHPDALRAFQTTVREGLRDAAETGLATLLETLRELETTPASKILEIDPRDPSVRSVVDDGFSRSV